MKNLKMLLVVLVVFIRRTRYKGGTSVARHVLTKFRVRASGAKGNQVYSVTVWTLGIPKMYMGTLGYNVLILH